jgi:hypothetical protein
MADEIGNRLGERLQQLFGSRPSSDTPTAQGVRPCVSAGFDLAIAVILGEQAV